MTTLFWILTVISVVDLVTSKIGKDKGLKEANPLYAKPAIALALNATALLAMWLWNPSSTIWYTVIGIRTAIVANNIRLIKKGGR